MGAVSCQKEDKDLPRDRFLGLWTAVNAVNGQRTPSVVSKGKQSNLIIWEINGERIELEFIGKQDSFAFQTNFSIPFFVDQSASLQLINTDSLYGIRSFGTILIPSTYKQINTIWSDKTDILLMLWANNIILKQRDITFRVSAVCTAFLVRRTVLS